MTFSHENLQKSRLLAKLVRELLHVEHFASLPDLTEALKCRCARLRIFWTNDDINDAFRLIESNTPLPGALLKKIPVFQEAVPAPAPPFSRVEAERLYRELLKNCGRDYREVNSVRAAPWADPEQAERELEAARQRAFEMGIEL